MPKTVQIRDLDDDICAGLARRAAEAGVSGPEAERIGARLAADADHAAPHVIDAEVLGVIRRQHLLGALDRTEATQAVEDLQDWPGERYGHRWLLERAWDLRATVRGWEAMYVALAEALDAVLITTDARLGAAAGPARAIETISGA